MSWDRHALGEKNIFYDDKIRPFPSRNDFPGHVWKVQELILDFSCAVIGAGTVTSEDRLRTMMTGPDPDPVLRVAQRIQWESQSIVDGGYKEDRWASFFVNNFFATLSDSLSLTKEDSRRVSQNKYYYDGMKRESDESWDLFEKDSETGVGFFKYLKKPKPDQAFFLPIYHLEAGCRIPAIVNPEARQWNQTPNLLAIEPFSWETLKKLNGFGLQPEPRRIFNKPRVEARLKCYPWFIVEHKKEEERGDVVSCQAANAAACALSLVQNSARYAVELIDQAHITPIPVMTSIGSRVTIWIAYYGKNFDAPCESSYTFEVTVKRRKEGYLMYAIWSGDMTKLVDIIKFQAILDNIHTWAMRMFRPMISSHIEQWKYVHCHPILSSQAAAAELWKAKEKRRQIVEERRTVVPIVQNLIEDHEKLQLDESSGHAITPLLLGLLMHRICSTQREQIHQQVERAVEDRLQNLGLAGSPSVNERRTNSTAFNSNSIPTSSIIVSTPTSRLSTVDNDDPNDPDWQESQEQSAPVSPINNAASVHLSLNDFSRPPATVLRPFSGNAIIRVPDSPRSRDPYFTLHEQQPKFGSDGDSSTAEGPRPPSSLSEKTSARTRIFTNISIPKQPGLFRGLRLGGGESLGSGSSTPRHSGQPSGVVGQGRLKDSEGTPIIDLCGESQDDGQVDQSK